MSRSWQALARAWEKDREKREHSLAQPLFADYRLVLPALILWAFTLAWVLAGGGAALGLVLLLVLMLGVVFVLGRLGFPGPRRVTGLGPLLLLALVLCAGQALSVVGRGFQERWSFMEVAQHSPVRFEGQVVDSVPASGGSFRTTVEAHEVVAGELALTSPVTLHIYTGQELTPGGAVSGSGSLQVEGAYYRVRGKVIEEHGASVDSRPLADIRASTRQQVGAVLEADQAGLLLGLAYGDDSLLTVEGRAAMKAAGLTHLTAVSGSNITLIFLLAYRLLAALRWPRKVLVVVGLLATVAYLTLVGLEGSVVRAWVMGLVGALGLLLGHGGYRVSALGTCLIGVVVADPELASHYGFILSVVATAALLFLAPVLVRLVSGALPLLIAECLAVPCAAALWCFPVLLVLSGQAYPYTVLANMLAAPLVAPLTLVGLLAFALLQVPLLGFLAPPVLGLGGFLASLLISLVRGIETLPASSVALPAGPGPVALALVTVGVVSFLLVRWDAALVRRSQPQRHGQSMAIYRQRKV